MFLLVLREILRETHKSIAILLKCDKKTAGDKNVSDCISLVGLLCIPLFNKCVICSRYVECHLFSLNHNWWIKKINNLRYLYKTIMWKKLVITNKYAVHLNANSHIYQIRADLCIIPNNNNRVVYSWYLTYSLTVNSKYFCYFFIDTLVMNPSQKCVAFAC